VRVGEKSYRNVIAVRDLPGTADRLGKNKKTLGKEIEKTEGSSQEGNPARGGNLDIKELDG